MGNELRVGLRTGQHLFDTDLEKTGSLGWAVGLRPCKGNVELELSHISYDDNSPVGMGSPVQLTTQLYINSGQGLSPYLGFGVHGAYNDGKEAAHLSDDEILLGFHGGLGLRYKMGALSVNVEGKYLSYFETEKPQMQGLAGINLHF